MLLFVVVIIILQKTFNVFIYILSAYKTCHFIPIYIYKMYFLTWIFFYFCKYVVYLLLLLLPIIYLYLFVCLFVCLFVYLFVCLFVGWLDTVNSQTLFSRVCLQLLLSIFHSVEFSRWNAAPEFSQESVISNGLMHQSIVSRQSLDLTEGMCLMKNMDALMPRNGSAQTDRDSAAVWSVWKWS